jgi:hypothetical protein
MVKKPKLVVTHFNMHSVVKCTCGFSGSYRSRFVAMHAVYASSVASGVALRHMRGEHGDFCEYKEVNKY